MIGKNDKSGIIIAGSGQLGRLLVEELDFADDLITVIDIDGESLNNKLSNSTCSTIEGDASNIEVLRKAGINCARAVIAATSDDHVNLMIARIASEIYDVATVFAVVNDTNILTINDGYNFSVLCPSLLMTQEVIAALKTKAG